MVVVIYLTRNDDKQTTKSNFMKMRKPLLFMQLLLMQISLSAQTTTPVARTAETEKEVLRLTNKLVVFPNPITEQLTVTGLNKGEYDKIVVYNMQGAPLLKQAINAGTARIDVSSLTEGVYLLVLHSSVTLKEKNLKFIVRK